MSRTPPKRMAARAGPRAMAVLAAVLMLAALFAQPVLAKGPGNGGSGGNGSGWMGGGGQGVGSDRQVSIDAGDSQARVRSMGGNGGVGDEIDFELNATNRFTVEMRYAGEVAGEPGQLMARLVFVDLVEFNDTDGDGLLDGGDTVVSAYSLQQVECERLEYRNTSLGGGVNVHTITARTRDGVFGLVSSIPDAPFTEGTSMSNSWMKLDIVVEGFPYTQSRTLLALRTRLETTARLTIVENSTGLDSYVAADEGFVGFEEGEVLGFYSWVRNATVDGKDVRVATTTMTTLGGVEIAHVYGRGSNVVHDPKLGMPLAEAVVIEAFDVLAVLLPYAIAAAVSAVVVVAIFSARRRGDDRAVD
jgi:hypothetical protein